MAPTVQKSTVQHQIIEEIDRNDELSSLQKQQQKDNTHDILESIDITSDGDISESEFRNAFEMTDEGITTLIDGQACSDDNQAAAFIGEQPAYFPSWEDPGKNRAYNQFQRSFRTWQSVGAVIQDGLGLPEEAKVLFKDNCNENASKTSPTKNEGLEKNKEEVENRRLGLEDFFQNLLSEKIPDSVSTGYLLGTLRLMPMQTSGPNGEGASWILEFENQLDLSTSKEVVTNHPLNNVRIRIIEEPGSDQMKIKVIPPSHLASFKDLSFTLTSAESSEISELLIRSGEY
jgi:hypothetical protein